MEREEILQSLRDLKSQLPVDGLDQATIEEQAKRFDDARRVRERAERRIRELEEKLKKDENYRSGKVALYDRSIEDNRRDLEDMIARSDRLASDLIRDDRRLEKERRNRVEAEQYSDEELLTRIDDNIARLERNTDRKNGELEALNASIQELENFIADQEANLGAESISEDIESMKEEDRAEIARLNLEIRNASTESMLAEYNFATSLNDLIADVERGNISEEVVQAKLVEYKARIPKQFLLRDAAARSEERLQLEEALAKYEPRLAELEEKLANEDNYRGVLADRLVAVRDAGQADLDRYTDEIRENGSRIAEINNETRRLEQANAEAQRLIEQRKEEIAALPNQRHPMKKHLEAEIARRENEISRNITTLHSLKSEKGMLSGSIDRLRELTKPLKAEIEKINKEIAEDAKKVNKSQQRLDRIERDELLAGIAATKSRLAYIEYDISETIDKIVGDLGVSIAKKEEEARLEAERIAKEAELEAKRQEELEKEAAKKKKKEEPKEEEKTPTPIMLGTGGAALNGVVKEDENGKNFIIIFGPNGEELVKVEIPKNIIIPEKKEEPIVPVEETEKTPVAPVEPEKEEEEKDKPVPVVAFTPASEELKEDIKKKGIIAKLKDQCKKLKEKAKEAKQWVKDHKKQLIAGGVLIAGLLVGMRGCEGHVQLPEENDQVIESVIEDEIEVDEEIEMPTFDFDDEQELDEETTQKSLEEVAKDVIRGDYGNYPERKENLEAEGYDYEDVQEIVNEMMKDLQPEQTTPEQTTPEQTTPEQTTPEQTTPEQTTPEQTTPEQTTPEQTTPEETTPEETTPEETTPEQTTPEDTNPNPDEDELIGEEFVPVDPEPVDPTPEIPVDPDPIDPNPNPGEDELIGEEFVPVDPEPVDPTPEIDPENDNIIEILPGEAYVAEDGNFVQFTGDGVNAEIGGDIIDIIEEDGKVSVVLGDNLVEEATATVEPTESIVQSSGVTEEEALEFYNQLGIPFVGEEIAEPTATAEASFEAPVFDEIPTYSENFDTVPAVEEAPEVTETIESAPVVESSGVTEEEALEFYAQLGLTPPENVEDNSMGGRSR